MKILFTDFVEGLVAEKNDHGSGVAQNERRTVPRFSHPSKFSRMGIVLGCTIGVAILVLGLILFLLARKILRAQQAREKEKECPKDSPSNEEPDRDHILLPIWSKWMAKEGHVDIAGAQPFESPALYPVQFPAHEAGFNRVKNPVFDVAMAREPALVTVQSEFEPDRSLNHNILHCGFVNPLYSEDMEAEPF